MIDRDRIDALNALLEDLNADIDRDDLPRGRKRRGRRLWLRLLASLVAALALSNLYFVNDLTDEVRLIINRMQEMTALFSRVSARMEQMRVDMAQIDRNVLLMPVVSAQMREMAGHVEVMEQTVSTLDESTGRLSEAITAMDGSVRDMTLRFRDLNRSVGAMGMDVDQMARPLP